MLTLATDTWKATFAVNQPFTPSEGVVFSAFALLLRKEYGARPLATDTQRTDFAVNFLCTPSEGVPHSREIPTPF